MSYRPYQHIERRKSRQIFVGSVPVGGGAPITVQTMTNTPTTDVAATVAQIQRAERAGVDIVRVSCPDQESALALKDIIRQVVQKFVLQLEAQLADRNITIETTDEAADWLAKNGFDELYGARPLARVIQEHIKKPLADDILFGKLSKGGHVKVVLKDGKIAFEFEIDTPKAREPGAPEIEEPALAE
jgi:hypothetical protein